jgi:hypothetical protein
MKRLTPFRKMKVTTPRIGKTPFPLKEVEREEREHERARIQHWVELGKDALVTEPPEDADPEAA